MVSPSSHSPSGGFVLLSAVLVSPVAAIAHQPTGLATSIMKKGRQHGIAASWDPDLLGFLRLLGH